MIDEAMAIGFGQLKRSPAEFWAMSLKEFRAAQRGLYGQVGPKAVRTKMTRARLDELKALYPDKEDARAE